MEEAKCSKCNRVKLIEAFNKGNNKNGRRSWCKKCQSKSNGIYKRRSEVKLRENKLARERLAKLPKEERILRYYIKRNKWKEKDLEGYLQYKKDSKSKWKKKDPVGFRRSVKSNNFKRKKRYKEAGEFNISSIVLLESYNLNTFNKNNFTCEYCRELIENNIYHLDHIIPVSKNGKNCTSNLAIVCKRCNMSKYNKLLEDWNSNTVYYINYRNIEMEIK